MSAAERTDDDSPQAEVDRMTTQERVTFLRDVTHRHNLRLSDVAHFTGYRISTVKGWFVDPGRPRHRVCPARAVVAMKNELNAGRVRRR